MDLLARRASEGRQFAIATVGHNGWVGVRYGPRWRFRVGDTRLRVGLTKPPTIILQPLLESLHFGRWAEVSIDPILYRPVEQVVHRGKSRMIAFVLSVNGQLVCTVGVGDSGVLGAHVSWVGRPGEPGDLDFNVGGLDSRTDEHIRWPELPEIKVGDTVTVRVIETNTIDTPTDRKTPAQLREEEREFLTEMEVEHKARVRRKIDEELPPFGALWEEPPTQ